MKKKIIYLLVLINLISPIFANENIPKKSFIAKVKDNFSYQIQLDFEEQCKEKTSKDLFLKTKASELLSFFVPSDFLLTEDYKYYQQGKGSMLGDLYELEKKFQNSEKMPNKEMKIYIIKQLIYNL